MYLAKAHLKTFNTANFYFALFAIDDSHQPRRKCGAYFSEEVGIWFGLVFLDLFEKEASIDVFRCILLRHYFGKVLMSITF
jgi:hypothetical protein